MISIFVPAYNEQRNLEATVQSILDAAGHAGDVALEIIIINDGSTDGTQSVIEKLKQEHPFVRSVLHEKNRGLGAGFREALALARYEKFCVVPGDNDLSVASMSTLFSRRNEADIVFLFFLNNEIRGKRRHVISSAFVLIYVVTFGIFVQYVNSPCIYATERLRALRIRSSRFSIFAEVNTKLLCQGSTYFEVAGYRQNGLIGSTSLSFRNLVEVISTYFKLVYEIKFASRRQFSQKPVRVSV